MKILMDPVLLKLSKTDQVALVDAEDFERVNQYPWHISSNGYVVTFKNRKAILLHRFIMNFPRGLVDHRFGNKLDNRKSELRVATKSQNAANTRVAPHKFKGVFPNGKRFMARTKLMGKPVYIGTYDTPEEAAKAYNVKAVELFGEFAKVNPV